MNNTNTKRTDVHAPSQIIPSDYEYFGQELIKIEGMGDVFAVMDARRIINEHMVKTGGAYSKHAHGGNCHICGSVNAIYTVLFHHKPSNTYIRTGQDCAQKLDANISDDTMNAFRMACKSGMEFQTGKRKAKAFLGQSQIASCWEIYESDASGNQETIVRDIVGKLIKYGSISEKQINFLRSLVTGIADRPAIEAKRSERRHAAAANCPSGRVVIVGTILSTKIVPTDFGNVEKMVVFSDSGFKVWGTMPGNLAAERGDKIEFTGTVTPSPNDAKFGFFKRPSGAKVLDRVAE